MGALRGAVAPRGGAVVPRGAVAAGGTGMEGAAASAAAATARDKTPDRNPEMQRPSSEHQPTPRVLPDQELGAVGGEDASFY